MINKVSQGVYSIAKNTCLFRELSFVKLAMSDDDTRPFMICVHVESTDTTKYFIATDGRRLHLIHYGVNEPVVAVVADGDYSIKADKDGLMLITKPDNGIFPNWRKVMPEGYTKHFMLSVGELKSKHDKSYGMAKVHYKLAKLADVCVQAEYVQALGGESDWHVWFGERNRALVFKTGNKIALIMPMGFDDDELPAVTELAMELGI